MLKQSLADELTFAGADMAKARKGIVLCAPCLANDGVKGLRAPEVHTTGVNRRPNRTGICRGGRARTPEAGQGGDEQPVLACSLCSGRREPGACQVCGRQTCSSCLRGLLCAPCLCGLARGSSTGPQPGTALAPQRLEWHPLKKGTAALHANGPRHAALLSRHNVQPATLKGLVEISRVEAAQQVPTTAAVKHRVPHVLYEY